MRIFLAIIIMVISAWSFISFCLWIDSEDSEINYECDGLVTTIAKIYWFSIITVIMLSILFGISYYISGLILCETSHNDYDYCETIEENKE